MNDICEFGLGHNYDGTLSSYAVFHESSLVPMSFEFGLPTSEHADLLGFDCLERSFRC